MKAISITGADLARMMGSGGPQTEPDPKRVELVNALRAVRDGGDVSRYHVLNRVKPETVGKHSFGVCWFAFFLSDRRPSANLLLACLAHDVPEFKSGDMPGDFKASLGSVFREEIEAGDDAYLKELGLDFELTEDEKNILRMSDLLDGLASCVEEHTMGNCRIHRALDNYTTMGRKFIDQHANTSYGKIGDMLFDLLGGNDGSH